MEFTLHPDDASRLSRSKLLARRPGATPRYRSVRLVWYDSPDRDLRARGLALEERQGLWRLERSIPGSFPWLPAQLPPEIARASLPADLGHAIPELLAPVAMFEGRLAITPLQTEAGPVEMALLRGSASGTPVCRLTLDGADAAVRDLALQLAGAFRLDVPRASLATDAMAIADGNQPPPRRLGAPRPMGDTTVAGAFADAIGHFTDVLGHFAPLVIAGGPDTEPVHQMRVAVRRARSTIAVFRHGLACPAVAAADRALKILGAMLGPARDWDVFTIETLPRIAAAFPDDAKLCLLAKAAQRQRDATHAALQAWLATPAFRQSCIGLAWLCGSESWHATLNPDEQAACALEPASFASHVLERRWKKVRTAGKSLETLAVPALHALRLRAKQARYAIEIFVPGTNAKPAQRLIRRLSVLQGHLGTLNDGAVAAGMLDALGGAGGRHGYAVGLVVGFLAASAGEMRPLILRAWKKFRRTARFWS